MHVFKGVQFQVSKNCMFFVVFSNLLQFVTGKLIFDCATVGADVGGMYFGPGAL